MRKILIVFLFLLALPVLVLGAFQPATLTDGVHKVIVRSQEEAQKFFGMGYHLPEAPNTCSDCTGSASGNTFEQRVNFYKNFVNGGKKLNASTTLWIARTVTAGEICNNKTIAVNSAAVAATHKVAASLDLTLAATSTLFRECLKNEGDEYEFDLINQSPTAATTTEIVAGTGCQIVYGVADGDATIPGQKGATITLKRIKDWLADGGSKDCIVKIYEWN